VEIGFGNFFSLNQAQTLHFLVQKVKSDSRAGSWMGWMGKPQERGPADTAVHRAAPPKGAAPRAAPRTGKNPMQSLAQLRYVDISRAFKQAPWRVQIQVIATLASVAIVIVALGGLYLIEASRAATAGRDVQSLQVDKAELELSINRQLALIASAKSVARLEMRARELGYAPAQIGQIDFVVVKGYYGPQLHLPAAVAPAPEPELPDYNETLGTWLVGTLADMFGPGGE